MTRYKIEAKVHRIIPNGGYRVKVWFPDMEMYINGVLVYPPSEEHAKWGVLTPRAGKSGRGRQPRILEFNGKSELWHQFSEAAIKAVKEYQASGFDISPDEPEPLKISA